MGEYGRALYLNVKIDIFDFRFGKENWPRIRKVLQGSRNNDS
jgi:hypothetical protein